MTKPLYCALAFNSISFGAHGGSRPCCAVDTYYWSETKNKLSEYDNELLPWFNNKEMVDLRQDLLDGKWNPICNLCKIREDAGQPSTREIFNETLSQVEERTGRDWHETTAEIDDLDNIFLLDITVGNKCNSACLMCNSSASTLWLKEQTDLNGGKAPWHLDPMWFADEHVPNLVDNLTNLTDIQFVGGEPTINDDHVALLERLIEQDRAKDISLGYVTNLTNISKELTDLWHHFGTKHITISVDGVGKVNEYQRYPFTWQKVVSQLENIKNITNTGKFFVGLSLTVTSMNILKLDEVIEWWEDQVLSNSSFQTSLPHIQCVNNPSKFDPLYMPMQMKLECELTMQRIEALCERRGLGDKYAPAIHNIRTNILQKEASAEERNRHWDAMKVFVKRLDAYRKRNIFDYLPFMEKYWNLT
jgi:sulfatase maturation enzyme AslB (radical SAM superfamily)